MESNKETQQYSLLIKRQKKESDQLNKNENSIKSDKQKRIRKPKRNYSSSLSNSKANSSQRKYSDEKEDGNDGIQGSKQGSDKDKAESAYGNTRHHKNIFEITTCPPRQQSNFNHLKQHSSNVEVNVALDKFKSQHHVQRKFSKEEYNQKNSSDIEGQCPTQRKRQELSNQNFKDQQPQVANHHASNEGSHQLYNSTTNHILQSNQQQKPQAFPQASQFIPYPNYGQQQQKEYIIGGAPYGMQPQIIAYNNPGQQQQQLQFPPQSQQSAVVYIQQPGTGQMIDMKGMKTMMMPQMVEIYDGQSQQQYSNMGQQAAAKKAQDQQASYLNNESNNNNPQPMQFSQIIQHPGGQQNHQIILSSANNDFVQGMNGQQQIFLQPQSNQTQGQQAQAVYGYIQGAPGQPPTLIPLSQLANQQTQFQSNQVPFVVQNNPTIQLGQGQNQKYQQQQLMMNGQQQQLQPQMQILQQNPQGMYGQPIIYATQAPTMQQQPQQPQYQLVTTQSGQSYLMPITQQPSQYPQLNQQTVAYLQGDQALAAMNPQGMINLQIQIPQQQQSKLIGQINEFGQIVPAQVQPDHHELQHMMQNQQNNKDISGLCNMLQRNPNQQLYVTHMQQPQEQAQQQQQQITLMFDPMTQQYIQVETQQPGNSTQQMGLQVLQGNGGFIQTQSTPQQQQQQQQDNIIIQYQQQPSLLNQSQQQQQQQQDKRVLSLDCVQQQPPQQLQQNLLVQPQQQQQCQHSSYTLNGQLVVCDNCHKGKSGQQTAPYQIKGGADAKPVDVSNGYQIQQQQIQQRQQQIVYQTPQAIKGNGNLSYSKNLMNDYNSSQTFGQQQQLLQQQKSQMLQMKANEVNKSISQSSKQQDLQQILQQQQQEQQVKGQKQYYQSFSIFQTQKQPPMQSSPSVIQEKKTSIVQQKQQQFNLVNNEIQLKSSNNSFVATQLEEQIVKEAPPVSLLALPQAQNLKVESQNENEDEGGEAVEAQLQSQEEEEQKLIINNDYQQQIASSEKQAENNEPNLSCPESLLPGNNPEQQQNQIQQDQLNSESPNQCVIGGQQSTISEVGVSVQQESERQNCAQAQEPIMKLLNEEEDQDLNSRLAILQKSFTIDLLNRKNLGHKYEFKGTAFAHIMQTENKKDDLTFFQFGGSKPSNGENEQRPNQ